MLKTNGAIALFLLTLSPFTAFATPLCNKSDLRHAPVGFKCVTTRGAIFERVTKNYLGEAWMDPDGLIWGDRDDADRDYYNLKVAGYVCAQNGNFLPSVEDFKRGESYGFREVLPNIEKEEYWTSTSNYTNAHGLDSYNWNYTYSTFDSSEKLRQVFEPYDFRCVASQNN